MLVDTVMKTEAAQPVYGHPILTSTQTDKTSDYVDGYHWITGYRLKFSGQTSGYGATGRVRFPAVVSHNLKSFPKTRLVFFDSTRPDAEAEDGAYAGTTIQASGTRQLKWKRMPFQRLWLRWLSGLSSNSARQTQATRRSYSVRRLCGD